MRRQLKHSLVKAIRSLEKQDLEPAVIRMFHDKLLHFGSASEQIQVTDVIGLLSGRPVSIPETFSKIGALMALRLEQTGYKSRNEYGLDLRICNHIYRCHAEATTCLVWS